MSNTESGALRGANVVSALVVALAAFLVGLAIASAGSPAEAWPAMVIFGIVMTVPAVLAARILWHAWADARPSTLDGPARMLATAVAAGPAEFREWGVAMTAELDQVPGRVNRWRFAAGCAVAVLFPPRGRARALPVAAGVLAATFGTAVAMDVVLPSLTTFAVAFVVAVGVLVMVAVARSRRPTPVAGTVGAVGVGVCVWLVADLVRTHPSADAGLGQGDAVRLAVLLVGCGWVLAVPPRWLAGDRVARWVGTAAGLLLGGGLLVHARLDTDHDGVMGYMFLGPLVGFFVAAALGAALGGSMRAGLRTVVWLAATGSLAVFAVWQLEAVRWHELGGGLLLDGEGGPIGVNLADAVWITMVAATWALPAGVLGASAVSTNVDGFIGGSRFPLARRRRSRIPGCIRVLRQRRRREAGPSRSPGERWWTPH